MSPLFDRHSRLVSSSVFRLLRPIFRYSFTLDAYVLRGVGRRFGPVLKRREVSQ
jgi:hypothetical protein